MGAASVLLGEKLVSTNLAPPIPHCSAGPDELKLVQIVFRYWQTANLRQP